jgi:hypothetical protein
MAGRAGTPAQRDVVVKRSDGYQQRVQKPPNHWFKTVFYVLIAAIGIFLAVVPGVLGGHWVFIVWGGALIAGAGIPLRLISQGRNPWWMHGPLDRRAANRHRG